MYENNIAAAKVENKDSSWFRIKSGVKQGHISSEYIPLDKANRDATHPLPS